MSGHPYQTFPSISFKPHLFGVFYPEGWDDPSAFQHVSKNSGSESLLQKRAASTANHQPPLHRVIG